MTHINAFDQSREHLNTDDSYSCDFCRDQRSSTDDCMKLQVLCRDRHFLKCTKLHSYPTHQKKSRKDDNNVSFILKLLGGGNDLNRVGSQKTNIKFPFLDENADNFLKDVKNLYHEKQPTGTLFCMQYASNHLMKTPNYFSRHELDSKPYEFLNFLLPDLKVGTPEYEREYKALVNPHSGNYDISLALKMFQDRKHFCQQILHTKKDFRELTFSYRGHDQFKGLLIHQGNEYGGHYRCIAHHSKSGQFIHHDSLKSTPDLILNERVFNEFDFNGT